MKAVRGFVVTVMLGLSLVLFLVSAFATPDVESDVTVPLIVFLLVTGQSNFLPSCDVVLYPQTVVVSASVNLNNYQWLPPNEAENALLHLVPKLSEDEIVVVFPEQKKTVKVLADLRGFSARVYSDSWCKAAGFVERSAVYVIGIRRTGASGGGDKDDDPNWLWKLWSWLKDNLLCGGKGEQDINFPEDPLDIENNLVDLKRAISPTFSEKTVYWTLQWENGPPSGPINPPASRRPRSPAFSIISGTTGCFCWRRRTSHIVLHSDPFLPGFMPVDPQEYLAETVSIQTQLNQLFFTEEDSAGSDPGISNQLSASESELTCSEGEELFCVESMDESSDSASVMSVEEEGVHPENNQENNQEYIHLDLWPEAAASVDGLEEYDLGNVSQDEN